MADFQEAIKIVLRHEGGFVNDKDDAGGMTKYGISHKPYPREDIANLTIDRAKQIYENDYWLSIKGNAIRCQRIANKLLDMSVLIGIRNAVVCLQRALFSCNAIDKLSSVDGVVGERTLYAINNTAEYVLLPAFKSECAGYFRCLNNERYTSGWLNRAYE